MSKIVEEAGNSGRFWASDVTGPRTWNKETDDDIQQGELVMDRQQHDCVSFMAHSIRVFASERD
jgi:hypothetical protein